MIETIKEKTIKYPASSEDIAQALKECVDKINEIVRVVNNG